MLLQMRLPFGITSASCYSREIISQLPSDLKGVAGYLNDTLVSGKNAKDHRNNLYQLLQKLQEHGLRFCLDICEFAKATFDILYLSQDIFKGKKVNEKRKMARPHNLSTLKSFFGLVVLWKVFAKLAYDY